MFSLKNFHLLFILLAIVGADLFGVWAVYQYAGSRDPATLALGIISLVGGLGLVVYALSVVRKFERLHIQ